MHVKAGHGSAILERHASGRSPSRFSASGSIQAGEVGAMHVRRIPLAILGVVGLLLVAGTVAFGSPSPSIPALTPTVADQIPNIDVLRQEIRNYYGDPAGTGTFSSNSNYA